MRRPLAVCLDAAGTLFSERESRPALYARAFGEAGAPVSAALLGTWMDEEHAALPEAPGAPRYTDAWFRAFVGRLLRRAGSPADAEAVRARLAEVFTSPATYVVYAEVPDALEDLLAAGVRLACVSNWSDRLPALLEGLGLRRCFEALAVSAVVGASKPHPAIFAAALAALDLPASRALHVGDRPDNDVAGARRAGLEALLLDREHRAAGQGVVHDLREVVTLVTARARG